MADWVNMLLPALPTNTLFLHTVHFSQKNCDDNEQERRKKNKFPES